MLKSLQVGRGFAALLVVLHHLGGATSSPKYFGLTAWNKPFYWGDSGVDFFFVLSGFLILWIHFGDINRPQAFLGYALKRANRIYPFYWLIFALAVSGALLSGSNSEVMPHDVITFVKSLLLLPQDPAVVGGSGSPVIIVAWSLQYEICFYALIGAFILRWWLGALGVLLLVGNGIYCASSGCAFPSSFFASPFVLLFGMGAAVVLCMKAKIALPRPEWLGPAAALLFVAYGVSEVVFGRPSLIDRRLIYGLLSTLIIFGFVARDLKSPASYPRALMLLGDASYSLYLIHYPLIVLLFKLATGLGLTRAGTTGAAFTYASTLVLCIAAAVLVHRYVEKPLLERLNRLRESAPQLRRVAAS